MLYSLECNSKGPSVGTSFSLCGSQPSMNETSKVLRKIYFCKV